MKTLRFLTVMAVVIAFTAIASTFVDWNKGKAYIVGNSVDDFSLKNTQGTTVSLSDFKDAKGFILVFTSLRCPYSYGYERKLEALQKTYGEQGYQVIAIDPTISETDIFHKTRKYIGSRTIGFSYLMDGEQTIAHRFGVQKVPQALIIRKEKGFNILKYVGAIENVSYNISQKDGFYLRDAMKILLKGKELPAMSMENFAGCQLGK